MVRLRTGVGKRGVSVNGSEAVRKIMLTEIGKFNVHSVRL